MFKPYRKAEISFEKKEEIGHSGQNSKVYKCYDNQLHADLAIKEIKKSEFNGGEDDFFNEAKTLYLSQHSNVVPIHYACQDDSYIYLAMPYYRNGSMSEIISSRYLTVREIIEYSCHFLTGLHNIHSKGLIHFDVKPDNILISDKGEALISDFGQAKFMDCRGEAEQDIFYFKQMPPEYYSRRDIYRIQLDVYQVGVTLYRMCNGNQDFYSQFAKYFSDSRSDREGFQHAVVNEQFPNRRNYPCHIPLRLRNLINKCLKSDISQRFASVSEICNALALIGGNELDWVYSCSEEDKTRKWEKETKDKYVFLEVYANNSSIAKKKCKTECASELSISKYCLESISDSEIKQFLKEN